LLLKQHSYFPFFLKMESDRVAVKVDCVDSGPQLSDRNFIVIAS